MSSSARLIQKQKMAPVSKWREIQYRSKLDSRLDSRSSKILRIKSQVEFPNSQVGSFEFQVKKNNELAGWLSFREVNWIREALLCDVEEKASRLSSSCLTKNAFNLSLLPERATNNLSRYCNSQNDWSSQLIRTSCTHLTRLKTWGFLYSNGQRFWSRFVRLPCNAVLFRKF